MKLVLVMLFSALTVKLGEAYNTQYDGIDLDEIMNNDRLYKKYFQCLVGKGKCTSDGKKLKKNLPDAIKTECSKCNEKEKQDSQKVLHFMLSNRMDDYAELEKIYDPEGLFRKNKGS